MKKLLQINLCSNVLSTGKIAEDIGELAIEAGWESYVAYGMKKCNPSKSKTIKIGGSGIFWPYVETLLWDNHSLGLSCRRATKKLICEIEKIKPDVIQLHTIHCYYLNLRILFEYLSNVDIPVVWTLHDCWAFTGHCAYFDAIGCGKWKTHCFSCPQKNKYPKSYFIDRSSKNFAEKKFLFNSVKDLTLVSVSEWLKDLVAQSFLQNKPSKLILNGIKTDLFKYNADGARQFRAQRGLDSNFLMLGVASSWTERKGLADYCKLASLLDEKSRLVLVGLNPKQRQMLPDNIISINRTSDIQELVAIYSAADVVLNLSVEETFGMTTIEGFACGTPGIVYDKTASPELITPDTGFMVEAGNMDQLTEALSMIRSNGRDYYSSACRRRAETYYDKNKNFLQYIALYNDLTSRKQNVVNENINCCK